MPYYVALYTQLPTEKSPLGVEVSAAEYSRISVNLIPKGAQVVNQNDVVFPVAISDWGVLEGFGLFEDSHLLSSSRLLRSSGFRSGPIRVPAGTTVSLLQGAFTADPEVLLTKEQIIDLLFPKQFPPVLGKTFWDHLNEDD